MPPEVDAAINEYTTRGGSEATAWTRESVDDRIEAIATRFDERVLTQLHWARFSMYRHASEILHGTFNGALFALGMSRPEGPPEGEALKAHFNEHLSMVLLMSGMALDALIRRLGDVFASPELVELSAESLAAAREHWE